MAAIVVAYVVVVVVALVAIDLVFDKTRLWGYTNLGLKSTS